MLAAGGLFVLGAGVTAAGIWWSALYDVGILMLVVAAVGILVRAGDWARVLLAGRPDADGGPALPRERSGGDAS